MEQHVKIIGIIYIVLGALGILVGLGVLAAFMIGGAALSGEADVPAGFGAVLAGFGLVAGILIIATSVFEIFVAVNLRKLRPWARIAQLILSGLGLLSFPFGTALGVYVLWALLNKETAEMFEGKPASE